MRTDEMKDYNIDIYLAEILGMIRIGRAEIPIDQSLSLSWSRSEAAARRASYQRALRFALVLDAAVAVYALLAPNSRRIRPSGPGRIASPIRADLIVPFGVPNPR
ncbi:MAG: hypothetical protein ACXW3N_12390, partial [Rhodoplanes sp.]